MRIPRLLILLFAVTSGTRTLFVTSPGQMNAEILWLTTWSIPVIAIATYAGRRFPLPFTSLTMRRIAFVVLMMTALS